MQGRWGEFSPFGAGIPLVELADKTIEEIYYFRWHTYCQQIKKTPRGYVVTDISARCALGRRL